MFGGLTGQVNELPTTCENCIWRLNLVDLRWEKIETEIPVNSYFHAACENVNIIATILNTKLFLNKQLIF